MKIIALTAAIFLSTSPLTAPGDKEIVVPPIAISTTTGAAGIG